MTKESTKYAIIEHLSTTYSARVKFNEADPLGIVWHGNYIAYFEEGREAFGRKHELTYLDIYNAGYSTPIVNLVTDFKHPLKYGDEYTIVTHILNNKSAKIIHLYEIYNQENRLVCEGQTTQIFLDTDGTLSLYSPTFYEAWKKKVNFK